MGFFEKLFHLRGLKRRYAFYLVNKKYVGVRKFEQKRKALIKIGYEIGEAAAPIIVEALKVLKDVITDLKAKWDELTPAQQDMIVKWALVAAAVGPVSAQHLAAQGIVRQACDPH